MTGSRIALCLFVVVATSIVGCGIEPNPSPWHDSPVDMESKDPMGNGGGLGSDYTEADASSHLPGGWTGGTGSDSADGWDGGDSLDGSSGTTSGTGTSTTSPPTTEDSCTPICSGKQCGPDGCGGTCGWCSGAQSCQSGICVEVPDCQPLCAGKMIGEADNCGGVCSGSGMGIGLKPGGAQDAAYFRQQVLAGKVPSPDLLPIEGWLNEHDTPLPPALTDRLVTLHGFVGLFYDPEQGEPTMALQLGMNSGLSAEAIEAGRFNLSVVIDRSGSMQQEKKFEYVKQGLIKMLDALDEDDYLSIVTYSTAAKVILEPTKVSDKDAIIELIQNLKPGGKTNLYAGLELGYEQILKNAADKEAMPRVILLSDGQANEGIFAKPAILAMSSSYNNADIGITTIGVGSEFNFALMHGLATQGEGNFYFLDSAEKLAQVFQEEIKYLLTPVADNLKIWFTLPDGFGVEDVYGFDYKQVEDGSFQLLSPKPQYTVSDETTETQPPGPDDEAPNVAVSTLFASKRNGLLMIKIKPLSADTLIDYENKVLASVYYEYNLVNEGTMESWHTPIELGSISSESEVGSQYFSGDTMQRNFCILRAGLAMKTATALWEEDKEGNLQSAINNLTWAATFCKSINVHLNDARLIEDISLLEHLKDNICESAQCQNPS